MAIFRPLFASLFQVRGLSSGATSIRPGSFLASPCGINSYQCRGMRRAFNHCCIEYSCFMCRMGSALTLSGLWEPPPPGAILSPSMQRGLQVFLFFVSGPAAWQLTRALLSTLAVDRIPHSAALPKAVLDWSLGLEVAVVPPC